MVGDGFDIARLQQKIKRSSISLNLSTNLTLEAQNPRRDTIILSVSAVSGVGGWQSDLPVHFLVLKILNILFISSKK